MEYSFSEFDFSTFDKTISLNALAILPFPSSKGWIITNHRCAMAAFMMLGVCQLNLTYSAKNPPNQD